MAVVVTVAADMGVADTAAADMSAVVDMQVAVRLVEAAADIPAVVHHAAAAPQCTWADIPVAAHRA
jgi:hypothetical protein